MEMGVGKAKANPMAPAQWPGAKAQAVKAAMPTAMVETGAADRDPVRERRPDLGQAKVPPRPLNQGVRPIMDILRFRWSCRCG